MSSMIVARFDSVPSAKSAAHALIAEGFREEAVRLFRGEHYAGPSGAWARRTPVRRWSTRFSFAWRTALLAAVGTFVATLGAMLLVRGDLVIVGAAVSGACAGAALGAWWAGRRVSAWRMARLQNLREYGHAVLLAVHAESGEEDAVMALLHDAGGFQIDREHGLWRDGRWTERDTARRARSSRRTAMAHRTQWQL